MRITIYLEKPAEIFAEQKLRRVKKLRALFYTTLGLPREWRHPALYTESFAKDFRRYGRNKALHELSGDNVANGYYNPSNDKVYFNYNSADYENADYGFREAIDVPLKPQPSIP